MKPLERAQLLRIFIGESDHHQGRPLYEVIVQEARVAGLAGATVLRGIMGYGPTSRVIHSAKILRLSEDLPIIVEIVDHADRIEGFLPRIDELLSGGLVTLEDVQVLHYRGDESKK